MYCCDHPAAALLEILVHIDAEDAPSDYQLLGIDVPEGAGIAVPDLPQNWRDDQPTSQRIGMAFLREGAAPILEVPSAIVPFASNFLLNPTLLDASGIRIVSQTLHPIDARLLA